MKQDLNAWNQIVREAVKKANEQELYVIARLAAAAVRKEILDEMIDQFDDKIKEVGARRVIEGLAAKANEREIKVIARLAAAVVGNRKEK